MNSEINSIKHLGLDPPYTNKHFIRNQSMLRTAFPDNFPKPISKAKLRPTHFLIPIK